MLSEFVRNHRDEIISRCRTRVAGRMRLGRLGPELDHGIPLFLRELEQILVSKLSHPAGATTAFQHGGELLRSGFTVAQVVHGYGDACQTITELAIEYRAPISTAEFRALNSCLDNAIADAVTEYERQHDIEVIAEDTRRSNQHLGFIAHELRNTLSSALLAYDVLRGGSVGIRGSTGDVLGRSLVGLRDLVDRSLTEVRLTAGVAHAENILLARFIEDIEVSAVLSANLRGIRLSVSEVDPTLTLETDRQILSSIVSNLLQNAFKYTPLQGHVWLRTHATADGVLFEIEDQCGGIPPGKSERMFEPYVQQSIDRSGLGLGLAICVRGVNALRGAISVRNLNHGCVFTVDLPRSAVHPPQPE
jgi:signal transduction histidine kinase